MGLCVLTLLTSANQTIQLTTSPAVRGRVMSIYMMFLLGTTPVGAPVIGWVSDQWGPRTGIAAGGAAAVVSALAAMAWVRRHRCADLAYSSSRPFLCAAGSDGAAPDRPGAAGPDGAPGASSSGAAISPSDGDASETPSADPD